jgi:hypothetical protein
VGEKFEDESREVEVSMQLLARFSSQFKKLLQKHDWIYETNEEVGRLSLPKINANAARQAVKFLEGGPLVIPATDKEVKTTDDRTISTLVQISSFAHLLGIECLQLPVMHALWQFLVMNKQSRRAYPFEKERKRLFSGCPAAIILDECIKRSRTSSDETIVPTVRAQRPLKGEYVESTVEVALSPETIPDWNLLTKDVWERLHDNGYIKDFWKRLGVFRSLKKSLKESRSRLRPDLRLDRPAVGHPYTVDNDSSVSRSPSPDRNTSDDELPGMWEGVTTDVDELVARHVPKALERVRAAKHIPLFTGFEVMEKSLGCRFLIMVLLTEYSPVYKTALPRGTSPSSVPSDLRADALTSIAQYLLDLARTDGKAMAMQLNDTNHALEVLRVAFCLQIEPVHRRLITTLHTRLPYEVFDAEVSSEPVAETS